MVAGTMNSTSISKARPNGCATPPGLWRKRGVGKVGMVKTECTRVYRTF